MLGRVSGATCGAGHLVQRRPLIAALCICVLLGRIVQLSAIFRVESRRMSLTRHRAAVFVDAFPTPAAQAFLRDALEAPSH